MSKTLVTLPTSPSFTAVTLNTSPSSTLVTLNTSPSFTAVSLPSSTNWTMPGTWNGLDAKNWEDITSNWNTTGMLGGDST